VEEDVYNEQVFPNWEGIVGFLDPVTMQYFWQLYDKTEHWDESCCM